MQDIAVTTTHLMPCGRVRVRGFLDIQRSSSQFYELGLSTDQALLLGRDLINAATEQRLGVAKLEISDITGAASHGAQIEQGSRGDGVEAGE